MRKQSIRRQPGPAGAGGRTQTRSQRASGRTLPQTGQGDRRSGRSKQRTSRRRSRAAGRARAKPARRGQRAGGIRQAGTTAAEYLAGIMDRQLLNIEIKLAIQQFMINQLLDRLVTSGIWDEQQQKTLYSETYKYWKNELQEMGSPFAPLDLEASPVLQAVRRGLHGQGDEELTMPAGALPSAPPPNSSQIQEGQAEWSAYLSAFKQEIKQLKKDMMKQQMEELKRSLTMRGPRPPAP